MLDGLFRSSEEKIRAKVEEHLENGMKMISEKFYNGALIEFDKAMELNREEVYPWLLKELDKFAGSGQLEAALAIGMNLMKVNSQDFELANKLGNFARELKNYNQAEGLYKLALKVNKSYERAFYNLAACTARVDKYDDAVTSALGIFDDAGQYILPDYWWEGDLEADLTNRIRTRKDTETAQKIQEYSLNKEAKEAEGALVEAKELDYRIKELKESAAKVTPDDIIEELQDELSHLQPGSLEYKKAQYNIGLFALSRKKNDIARACFKELSLAEFDNLELLDAIMLDQEGDTEKATQKMIRLLGENEFNRYNNVNLGLMYRRQGKKFLAAKYLIKTAALLEKSNGIYSMKALIKVAHENFAQGHLKKALNYYTIAASEMPDPKVLENMGNIYIQQKKYEDAVESFRKLQKLDADSEIAKAKLKEIHDYYFEKGDALLEDRKFKPAADYFHKALGVLRLPETVRKTALTYKHLKNPEMEEELMTEYKGMLDELKNAETEVERQKMITEAKAYMQKKNYIKAIQTYESVFRMKVDKNVFLQLAALYKGLKKMDDLNGLVVRWNKMVEHEEKMKRFAKEQERDVKSPPQES